MFNFNFFGFPRSAASCALRLVKTEPTLEGCGQPSPSTL